MRMVARPGGFLVVFFGYTQCPDVCPMTLSNLKAAISRQSAADAARVVPGMVTVDPSRDTAPVLTRYVHGYFPHGIAIREADPVRLRTAADVFGAEYRTWTDGEGRLQVSHSGDLYAVDEKGMVVLTWPYGTGPDAIEHDLRRLLDGDRPEPRGAR